MLTTIVLILLTASIALPIIYALSISIWGKESHIDVIKARAAVSLSLFSSGLLFTFNNIEHTLLNIGLLLVAYVVILAIIINIMTYCIFRKKEL